MPRLTSLEKGGFYAFPKEHLPAVASLFAPAPDGGRLLDPCAGEGRALQHLANAWKLTPYANELDSERAAACQALKVAIILAALDWISLGERRQGRPVVRAAHWYRAQQIVETWRASAHRLLHDLGESEEARLEMRILKLLSSNANGLSVRDIYRALRSPRKPVMEALKALEQDGQVEQHYARSGQHGPKAECYRLVAIQGP